MAAPNYELDKQSAPPDTSAGADLLAHPDNPAHTEKRTESIEQARAKFTRSEQGASIEYGQPDKLYAASTDKPTPSKDSAVPVKDSIPEITGKPEDLKHLAEARAKLLEVMEKRAKVLKEKEAKERLLHPSDDPLADVAQSSLDDRQFKKDMQTFEERAAKQPLSAKEVADTYDQLSRLLEDSDGKVPYENRARAAQSFIHHAADPMNIDTGHHETCNVTTLEQRLITRSPSKAAEMVATTALTGQWVAPDGKVIKIDEGSLTPGEEEKNKIPFDGDRSYATQILNLVMVNDVVQRRDRPLFYSQVKPEGQDDEGERMKFADGSDVPTDYFRDDGDKTPWNKPKVSTDDMAQFGKRLTGESNFIVMATGIDTEPSPDIAYVDGPKQLGEKLQEMISQKQLPAIILVDTERGGTVFGGGLGTDATKKDGDPLAQKRKPRWHVISVIDFDEKTGKVKLKNEWGRWRDRTVDINDLYQSMGGN